MSFLPTRLLSSLALLTLAASSCAEDIQGLVIPFKQISISSPVLQEVIDAVLVEEGDAVKENQVVIELRKEKEVLEVEQAEKVVEQKAFTAKGAERLFNEKIGSQEVALEKGTELALAKIQLAAAQVRLKEKTIRTPINGIVVKKYKEAGEAVDRVEKLLDIVNIDQVYVQFYLDPKFLERVKADTELSVHFAALGAEKFPGKISFVDPRIDAGSGLFRVKVLLANRDHRIKAGMRGLADFTRLSQ